MPQPLSQRSPRCLVLAIAMDNMQNSFAAAIPPPSNTYAAPIRLHLSRSLLRYPLAPSSSTLAHRRCSSPPSYRHASLSVLVVAVARPPRVATNRARAWNGCGWSLPSWHGVALIVDALRTTSVGFRPSVRPPAHPPPPTSLLRSATASPACSSAFNSDQGPRAQI